MGKTFTVGKPIKYTQKQRLELLKELEAYIKSEEFPSMPQFCVKHGISKQRIYEWAKDEKLNSEGRESYPLGEYFTELIQLMNTRQEAFIEEHVMVGHLSVAWAVFKMKQPNIGWVDKSDVGLSGEVTGNIDLKAIHKKLEDALLNEPGTV
jgi:hypothetical protein